MIKKGQIDKIFECIKLGVRNVTDICMWADVSTVWYYQKLKDDAKFAKRIEKAMLERKVRAITIIQKAAITRWPAAAWFLERTHPEEFALHYKAQLTGKNEAPLYPVMDLSKMDEKALEKLGERLDAIIRPQQSKTVD